MSYSTGCSRIVLPAGPRLLAYAKRVGMLGAQSQKKKIPRLMISDQICIQMQKKTLPH